MHFQNFLIFVTMKNKIMFENPNCVLTIFLVGIKSKILDQVVVKNVVTT